MKLVRSWKTLATLILMMGLSIGCANDKAVDEAIGGANLTDPSTPPDSSDDVTQPVYFDFDDYTLNGYSQESLTRLSEFLQNNSSAVVQIEGHCDERGSIEYNLALGQRRAQSVKNYLTDLGIDPSRLPTMSYGEERPAVSGSDESAWEKNRRAEFVLSNP